MHIFFICWINCRRQIKVINAYDALPSWTPTEAIYYGVSGAPAWNSIVLVLDANCIIVMLFLVHITRISSTRTKSVTFLVSLFALLYEF